MTQSGRIRKPAVAGFFYPGSAQALADEIDAMIEAAGAPATVPAAGIARVLVSPHAGYRYSGPVAAHGFRYLRGQDAHTVVVISPSHVEYFGFSSVYGGGGYETPLGVATTSTELSRRLASANDRVIESDNGHEQMHLTRQEHALEVQIPFLQRALNSFELVAVVMGDQGWDNCVALGEALKPLAEDPGVLIVASTDLSHFHGADRATELDGAFRDALLTMDAAALYETVESGRSEACGAGPVIASLMATESLANRACAALSLRNSGDAAGDYSNVVGYLSAVITADV
jgi:AmmeMemoRadiSam system protein B